MPRITIILAALFFLFGCRTTLERRAWEVVEAEQDNQAELHKFLEHYKQLGSRDKYLAACFLVANMPNKYSQGEDFPSPVFDLKVVKADSLINSVERREPYRETLTLKNNYGHVQEYVLEVVGWIGAYISTRGRKATLTDFPDNFISLYSNKKLGEFNILPVVGQNKLSEVYVVGQLHVDLFELSELPDMALSNRQGYKTDDPRYKAVSKYVREQLLPDILRRRSIYADEANKEKKKYKLEEQKGNEAKFRAAVDSFKAKVSENAAVGIGKLASESSKETIERVISDAINDNAQVLGLKTVVDSQKKKILISHASSDKGLADLIYSFLLYNGIPPEDILYTSCDDEASRIPEGTTSIYNYLRDFFVESYSNQKIFVIFVTSNNTQSAWGGDDRNRGFMDYASR